MVEGQRQPGDGTGHQPDRIEIRGLRVTAYHGVGVEEARRGQLFVVDLTLETDTRAAGDSDDLADTVDYGAVTSAIAEAVRSTRFALLEALCRHLAELALADRRVTAATVRVAKPQAPLDETVDEVAVVIHRGRPGAASPE